MTETPLRTWYRIPYSRPLLPDPIALLPYLHQINRNRYYSNTGPLVLEYESRLQHLFGAPCVTASSCTSALTACLLALDLPKGSLIACPSWTFVATPAAIVAAGHIPYFVDVDNHGVLSQLSPACLAMVIVSPFGTPLHIQRWNAYLQKINIPIIIDAAAGFDAFSTICKPGNIPTCISTHATKTFGTGEGGFVTCTDAAFLHKVRNILNFGMDKERKVGICGINGKLSEYHAAVGLASLDGWSDKRAEWIKRQEWYHGNHYIDSAKSTMTMYLDIPAAPVVQKLQAMGIEAKHGLYGCHTNFAFIASSRTDLSVTERLMENTIYLPMSVDMVKEDIEYVKSSLQQILQEAL